MTKAEPRRLRRITIYLDSSRKDADQGTRREAVLRSHLKDRGLKDDQIAIQAGPNLNPDNLHPTGAIVEDAASARCRRPVATNSDADVAAAGCRPDTQPLGLTGCAHRPEIRLCSARKSLQFYSV